MTAAPGIAVRPFRTKDAEAVAAMMGELAAFHGEEAAATAVDVLRHASGIGRISTLWVASRHGEPLGFAATYDWMNYVGGFPVRHIDLLFVREGARRCGVGRALIAALARDAASSGCRRITVGAEPDNEGANGFYRGMGFEVHRPAACRYRVSDDVFDLLAAEGAGIHVDPDRLLRQGPARTSSG